jgi:hypothetical protein
MHGQGGTQTLSDTCVNALAMLARLVRWKSQGESARLTDHPNRAYQLIVVRQLLVDELFRIRPRLQTNPIVATHTPRSWV